MFQNKSTFYVHDDGDGHDLWGSVLSDCFNNNTTLQSAIYLKIKTLHFDIVLCCISQKDSVCRERFLCYCVIQGEEGTVQPESSLQGHRNSPRGTCGFDWLTWRKKNSKASQSTSAHFAVEMKTACFFKPTHPHPGCPSHGRVRS